MNRQRSEVEGRLLNDLRSPQSTLTRRPPPPGSGSAPVEPSSSADLLRYRARSMDNVGVDQDAYEVVSYSRFGPSVQRRTTTTAAGSFGTLGRTPPRAPEEPSHFGYGRRAYQTLPRDARLPGTMVPPRGPSSGDQKTVQTSKYSEINRSTGSLNRRKSQEDRDEEITLRPIGPGVQPLESSVNPASTLSRVRLQHTPNAELENKPTPSIQLIPPTPGGASTFSHSSSTILRSNVRPEATALSGPGSSGQPMTTIATGSGPTRPRGAGSGSGNTLRFRNDEDGDMVVVEQAISPSQDRPYDGRGGGGPGSGSGTDQRLDQTVRRVLTPVPPQPVRTVVVSPQFPPSHGSNGTAGFAQGFQHQWGSNGDGVQAGSSTAWQGHSMGGGGGDQRRLGKNQSEDSEQRHFAIRSTIQDGVKGMGVKVENDQRHAFSAQPHNLQASQDQQFEQLLKQQQQQIEQQIFEQQKQLEQQQQQLFEQQQQLHKQLEQHRLLQQQLSRAGQQQQQQQQQQVPLLQQSQQQWSYEKTDQFQQPRTITIDQQQFRGRQLEQQQQQQQLGQQLQLEQNTYDLLPQQQQQLQNQQFRGQQQQLMQRQQHVDSHNFGNASINRQGPVVDNSRGFNPLLQNSVAVQNAQTTFRGQGQGQGQHAESSSSSMSAQPLYQSVSEAHGGGGGGGGQSQVTSPQFASPFSVFQSTGDPLSPTGASGPSPHAAIQRECRFEAVMPTYATPEKNHTFSGDGSGGKTTTIVRTYEQTISPPSNGAPGQDHRFHQIQRPGIVVPSPTNGTSPPGGGGGPGDVRISPESYWIQNSSATQHSVFEGPVRNDFGATGAAQVLDISGRDPRKNISGTSSVESSLSPLSVDITRMKWTDAQGQSSPSFLADRSSGGSMSSSRDGALEPSNQMSIKFVKDASQLWYKPQLSREEVISSLKNKAVGSFLVRDSNTYPGSYALAVKVAAVPDNAPAKKFNEDPSQELVRHFLIESTPTGVRLKGYKSESVFGSLAALINQHSITPLSLPCRLLLPASGNNDSGEILLRSVETSPSTGQLSLPSFNVLYIMSTGIELLSGPEAVDRAATAALEKSSTLKTTVVSLKVAQNGVTITDNNRSLFFRQHFPAELIRYCGLDRRLRCWTHLNQQTGQITKNKIFGIISRRSGLSNECHLFAEMDSNALSSAGSVLNFINQIIPMHDRK